MSGRGGGAAQWGVCPGGLSAWGCLPGGGVHLPLWTDAYENITFPQLLLRTVIKLFVVQADHQIDYRVPLREVPEGNAINSLNTLCGNG